VQQLGAFGPPIMLLTTVVSHAGARTNAVSSPSPGLGHVVANRILCEMSRIVIGRAMRAAVAFTSSCIAQTNTAVVESQGPGTNREASRFDPEAGWQERGLATPRFG
jgi:hypothetical protein